MPRYEIRYRKPPHAHGFVTISTPDEFDAQLEAEQRFGDDLISVREVLPGDSSYAEAHDLIFRCVSKAPGWLRKIGIALDPRQG